MVISGVSLLTGSVKWALAKAWPAVFGKPAPRTGRHRRTVS